VVIPPPPPLPRLEDGGLASEQDRTPIAVGKTLFDLFRAPTGATAPSAV